MMAESKIPITEIAQTLQCSRHTVYKAIGLAVLQGQRRPAPTLAEAAD
jgi:DNA-binding GntR family transcriptional regulator